MIAFSVLYYFKIMINFLLFVYHSYTPEQRTLFFIPCASFAFLRDASSTKQGPVRVSNFDEISHYLAIFREVDLID